MEDTGRRGFLAFAAALSSGCLSAFDSGPGDTVLDPPEEYGMLRDADLMHPIHGEELREFTVHDPLAEREVTSTEFEGERHVVATMIFTRCTATCPIQTSNLVQVQADAAERGYEDDIALLAITMDPEYDTADVLAEYADEMDVDLEAGNFHFLRPEDEEDARRVIEEGLGGIYERQRIEEHSGGHGEGDNETGGHENGSMEGHENGSMEGHENGSMEGIHDSNTTSNDSSESESDDGASPGNNTGHSGQEYEHSDIMLFANQDGVVERAYTPDVPSPHTLVEDVRTVVEAYEE